jgi:HPr kinase/phosphorylase
MTTATAAERTPEPSTVHGVALCVGEAGVLVRGRSGAGKSSLAEELVEAARARGWFGRIVADDRVRLSAHGGRIVLAPHPLIAGRLERRGQGVFNVEHERAVVLRLVVDLVDRGANDEPPRYPSDVDRVVRVLGAPVPRLTAAIGEAAVARAVMAIISESGA